MTHQQVVEKSAGAAVDGQCPATEATGPAAWSQLEARAFNAVLPASREAGEWLPLTARRRIARAVLGEILDAVTDDANVALTRVHHVADLIDAGPNPEATTEETP